MFGLVGLAPATAAGLGAVADVDELSGVGLVADEAVVVETTMGAGAGLPMAVVPELTVV